VVTTAKIDLKAGDTIDGIGHYMTYGLCENADVCYKEKLLPIGVAEGCILKNNIARNKVITYEDVIVPKQRLIDVLRKEQEEYFKIVPS